MKNGKIILMVQTLALCLALTACGSESAPQTTPGVETTQTTQATEMTEATQVTVPTGTEETTLPEQEENTPPPAQSGPDMVFTPVSEQVTAKIEVNLRSAPSQGDDSTVLHTLENGEVIHRTGISNSGWSELSWNGETCYAVSSYLTTDLTYKPPVQIQTPFRSVNEQVTAKDVVNLRSLPSTTHPEVEIVAQLQNGQVVTRTGINEDVGWSRVEYQGQTLYCISSYLRLYVQDSPTEPSQDTPTEPSTETTETAE